MRDQFSLTELSDSFHRFEAENGLFDIRVKGRCVWDHLRYEVFEQLVVKRHGWSAAREKRSYPRILLGILSYGWFRLRWLLLPSPSYEVLLVNTTPGKYLEGGKRDIHMWPLARALSPHYRVLAFDHNVTAIDPALYPCDVLLTRPAYLFQRLKSLFIRFSPSEEEALSDIRRKLKEAFGIEVDVRAIARGNFALQLCLEDFFRWFLGKIRPRMLLYCDNGNVKGMLTAAHELGVIAVDMQHGVVSPTHVMYRYPPGLDMGRIKAALPKRIFTFGTFWNAQYSLPVRTVAVGSPHFDLQSEKPFRAPPQERAKRILISSVLLSRGILSELAVELARMLPDHTIYYKLRIDEYSSWKDHYPPSFRSGGNLVVIENYEKSIYDYFALCRYHVGTNSTTLFEGLAYGLTTFVLTLGRYEEVLPLIEGGHVFPVKDAAEIKARIGSEPPHPLPPEAIFRPGSGENARLAIADLLEEHPSS